MKSVGESAEACGTLFVKCLVVEGLLLYSVYACLPVKNLESFLLKLVCMFVLRIFFN